MADAPREFDIPEAVAAPKRRWSLSLVWLIPIVAVVVGGWLAVKAIQEQGPTITITFKTAEGLEAGKTKIKYKNVDVGEVKTIALSGDRKGVIVTAELMKGTERGLVQDTRFWVVRPRMAGGQISGLGTLLSGSYIGVDIGRSTIPLRAFTGLDVQPIVTGEDPGRQFVLHSEDLGSLDIGSPVNFRRLQVGQVVASTLDQDGKGVTFKIFLNAPYDQYVNRNTRFWNASGIDLTLDATGIKLETQSLTSILIGGIAFETPADSEVEPPADANAVFTLFPNRAQAMKRPDREVVLFTLYFKDSLRGLSPGAPVDFRGVIIGEIKSIEAEYDPARKVFNFPVEMAFYPERLRARFAGGPKRLVKQGDVAGQRAFIDAMVEKGFRAQLKTGSLLTGQLYVALDFFPDAPKAKMDWTKTPPTLPTTGGSLGDIQASLASIMKKLDTVPFEQISVDLRQALQTLTVMLETTERLAKRLDSEVAPAARVTLEAARRALDASERILATGSPLSQDVREALRELARAAQSLRVLADYIERHPEALIQGKKEGER